MASYSGKDFVALMLVFQYDGNDFDWMFQLEKESNIINLMCRYIDPNDILEEDEIESYLEYEAENTFEDLNIETSLLKKPSTIWGTAEDTMLLNAEIEASETLLNHLPKRAQTIKSLLETSSEEAGNSLQKCERAQHLCRLAENGCRTLSSQLLEAYYETVRDFENYSLSLNFEENSSATPQFFVQYSFDEIRREQECWSNTVGAALTRATSEVFAAETNSAQPKRPPIVGGNAETHKRLLKQIALLVGKIVKSRVVSIFQDYDHELILKSKSAFEELLSQIRRGNSIPLNIIEQENCKGMIFNLYKKIRAISETRERNNIVVPLMSKFTEECDYIASMYRLRTAQLKEISDIVQEQRDLKFLISILCQLDRATVKNTERLLRCFISCLPKNEGKVKIVPKMEHVVIKRDNSASPESSALIPLQGTPKCTVDMLQKLFAYDNVATASKQEEIIHSIRLLLAHFSERSLISNRLETFLFSGATTKPVVIDYNHLLMLQELTKEYNEILKKLSEAHSAVVELENAREQNPSSCAMRLFWVPFMNGNTERLEAIAAGDFSSFRIIKQQFGNYSKLDWSSVKKKKPCVN